MFEPETRQAFIQLARQKNFAPAALLALAEIESGGDAFAMIDGKREPIIRFEGHYFDRRLSGSKQAQARAAGLASPHAGAIRNPASQASRWKMLRLAASIDRVAAYESVSWGMGQVMGAHWQWLGFASVEALVQQCRRSPAGQIDLMLRYIDKAGLAPSLRARDWTAFARGYNGPQFAKNRYDRKLAAAFKKHQTALSAEPASEEPSTGWSLFTRLAVWLRDRLSLPAA